MQGPPHQYIQRISSYVLDKDHRKVQQATPKKLAAAIRGLSTKRSRRRPVRGEWSITEILAHLADAELAGSWRLRRVISQRGQPIQAFDQDAWAGAMIYQKQDARKSLERFRIQREANLLLLK